MRFSKLTDRQHALIVSLIGYLTMLVAYPIRFFLLDGIIQYPFSFYHTFALFSAVLHYIVYSIFCFSGLNLSRKLGKRIQRTMLCEALCTVLQLTTLFLLKHEHFSRGLMLISAAMNVALISLYHFLFVRLSAAHYRSGVDQHSVLLIGEGATATRYAGTALTNPEAGHRIIGCVSSDARHAPTPRFLGDFAHIEQVLASVTPDEAIIALPASRYIHIDAMIDGCEKYGVPLRIIPCYEERISSRVAPSKFEDIQMVGIRDIPLNHFGNALIKRTFDICLSAAALALLSPLMLLIALGVKLSTHESVFFAQERIGKDKKPFKMLKFRSMKTNAQENVAWSTQQDERRTRFGALIRKLSLDELPQLINVLRGDMSVIGPRPEIPFFVEQFRDEVPLYMIRHMVKPGITGLAQVHGCRGDTSIRRRIEFDIAYIENWTIWVDVRILLRTLPAMINDETLPGMKRRG